MKTAHRLKGRLATVGNVHDDLAGRPELLDAEVRSEVEVVSSRHNRRWLAGIAVAVVAVIVGVSIGDDADSVPPAASSTPSTRLPDEGRPEPTDADECVTSGPPTVRVPDFGGVPLDEAIDAAQVVGLRVVGTGTPDAEVATGDATVSAQSPESGANVPVGSCIGFRTVGSETFAEFFVQRAGEFVFERVDRSTPEPIEAREGLVCFTNPGWAFDGAPYDRGDSLTSLPSGADPGSVNDMGQCTLGTDT